MNFLILVFLFLLSCEQKQGSIDGYNFKNAASKRIELSSVLSEVSGLAFHDNQLLMHNDEKAILIFFDPKTDNYLARKEIYKKNGNLLKDDFEGIATYENVIYLINSMGEIYICKTEPDQSYRYTKINGPKGRYEFESLCTDRTKKKLYTITKDVGKKKEKKNRYIFMFDLEKNEYDNDPILSIDLNNVKKFTSVASFYPSAMELHPKRNTLFILSAKSNLLLEISLEGELLNFVKLKKKFHRQAEAITFDENGNLYIADEADGDVAILSLYEYQNN
jgi:uncharacterized protein YjiK